AGLGVGPIAAFGLFFLGDRVFHLDHPHLQTLMYLLLSVAGHLTIFLTRTRGPFWSIRPARILWMAVLGTQGVATLIAVYGLFMRKSCATRKPFGRSGIVQSWTWKSISSVVPKQAFRHLTPGRVSCAKNKDALLMIHGSTTFPSGLAWGTKTAEASWGSEGTSHQKSNVAAAAPAS
ncbi:MAG: hypothetical protein ACRD2O_07365, partial [Terriglobia bacterium]